MLTTPSLALQQQWPKLIFISQSFAQGLPVPPPACEWVTGTVSWCRAADTKPHQQCRQRHAGLAVSRILEWKNSRIAVTNTQKEHAAMRTNALQSSLVAPMYKWHSDIPSKIHPRRNRKTFTLILMTSVYMGDFDELYNKICSYFLLEF